MPIDFTRRCKALADGWWDHNNDKCLLGTERVGSGFEMANKYGWKLDRFESFFYLSYAFEIPIKRLTKEY